MGVVTANLKVVNPFDQSKFFRGKFLVDTGAKYTVLPKSVWQKLGLKPYRNQEFSLADGSTISRDISDARVLYEKTESVTPVILGEKNDSLLMGVVTLENLGYMINPFTRQIYPDTLMTI